MCRCSFLNGINTCHCSSVYSLYKAINFDISSCYSVQNLQVKSQETWGLEEELRQLANQDASFSDRLGGLRHVGGTATGSRVENGFWDFEGLNIKEENKPETSAHEEFVVRNFCC
jgi:hypothetical protein